MLRVNRRLRQFKCSDELLDDLAIKIVDCNAISALRSCRSRTFGQRPEIEDKEVDTKPKKYKTSSQKYFALQTRVLKCLV